ncbi:unnamed protein product [Caenorhabditis auriculariae]|uniref:Uncharacterized protein n=1 Tax=Caenorhabditis auriculariae TaxID=2777116 RepID=A0A8S1GTP8_9PELO|nr:unnamed protein product [Caenorhabditis auriculariae]
MEDVDLHEFHLPRRRRDDREVSFNTTSVQTEPIQKKDAQTEADDHVDVGCQTVQQPAEKPDNVRIDQKVVDMIIEALNENEKINFDRLLPFHLRENVHLEHVASYKIDEINFTEAESDVIAMRYGTSRRSLLLLGSRHHETFCSHQPRLLISTSSTTTTVPLAVCPFSVAFRSASQFAVGDSSGRLTLFSGQNVVQEEKIHNGCVTSIDFSTHGVLTSSDDGELKLSQFTATELVTIKTVRLTVGDLPRNIRKASSSSKNVAIVSVQRSASEAVVATETGGLWIARLPLLTLRSVALPAQPIHSVLFQSPYIAVCAQGQPVVILTAESFVEQLPISATISTRCGSHFVFSDSKRIVIWSCASAKICYDANLPCTAMTSFPPDTLVYLDDSHNLTTLLITYY